MIFYPGLYLKVKGGEVFSVSNKRGELSNAFKVISERSQLGHLRVELVSPLWSDYSEDFSDIFSKENFDECTKQN